MSKKGGRKKGGFEYYRTRDQLREYIKMPAVDKLKWLEEMWQFNFQVGKKNPKIAKIQEMFRKGEV